MTRTIRWIGCIAVLDRPTTDGRSIPDLKADRLPVPVYWRPGNFFPSLYPNFQLLGKVTKIQLHWSAYLVDATLELDLNALAEPGSDKTLWPAIDLDRDQQQLVAVCLVTDPAWGQLDPVITVT